MHIHTHIPGYWSEVPDLIWDLPGDLIGPHRVLVRLFAKPEVEAKEHEGEGYAEPHGQQGQHGGEGHLEREGRGGEDGSEMTAQLNLRSTLFNVTAAACEAPSQCTHVPDTQVNHTTYFSLNPQP